MSSLTVRRVGPLITPTTHPGVGSNVNGPSLVKAPAWLAEPPGRWLLYFAHHKGDHIRLATAAAPVGPYTLVQGGCLSVSESCFATETPQGVEPRNAIQAAAIEAEGYDEHFTPHVASPDVVVDHDLRRFVMAFHGLCDDGTQLTRIAESTDGLRFRVHEPLVALPYLRIVPDRVDGRWLAMSMPGVVYRSDDLLAWESGPMLFDERFRHCAVARRQGVLHVVWSRVGDDPEHLLHSTVELAGDWSTWRASEPRSLLRPETEWEGADLPSRPSARGQVTERVHELRDPAICCDGDEAWLLYSIAGESGIAIAELHGL